MSNTKHSCPNCGGAVLAVRWNAGYQYCKSKECFESLGRRSEIVTHEKPPAPGEVDLDPYDLDDVASAYEPD